MYLLDSHCHIDLYQDYVDVINECERQHIVTIAVTNAPSVFPACQQLVAGKKYLRPALGLHPELVQERHAELRLFKQYVGSTRFIGEVGLDYVTQDDTVRKLQRRVFEAVLHECAVAGNKILTVHSRRAADEVIDMIGEEFPGRIILHWYSGSLKTAQLALSRGCYFSVNPAMVASEGAKRLLASLPPERILTETDGPFTVAGTERSRPWHAAKVIVHLADQWGVEATDARSTVWQTFRGLLQSPVGD